MFDDGRLVAGGASIEAGGAFFGGPPDQILGGSSLERVLECGASDREIALLDRLLTITEADAPATASRDGM